MEKRALRHKNQSKISWSEPVRNVKKENKPDAANELLYPFRFIRIVMLKLLCLILIGRFDGYVIWRLIYFSITGLCKGAENLGRIARSKETRMG